EHHANLVPWLMLAAERRFEIRYLRLGEGGELELDQLEQLVEGAKLVSVTMCSNVLGTLVPLPPIVDAAHAAGALVAADAAQFVPHLRTDVSALGVDLLAFTGHKMLGPTGIGVLWARAELLDAMPPFLGGGEMITDVRLDGFVPNEPPWKFEAGTPPIAEAIGLAAAADYLDGLGLEAVRDHERALVGYAMGKLAADHGDDLVVHGPASPERRSGVLSFSFAGIHPHDLSQVLDTRGVCVRAGHHCAKPLMRRLGVPATARASVYVYNDEADIDELSDALSEARRIFG
ncbi:MAG: aminotransferase class V-fold PLP-dependent enzyme, partial [Acidimicrobiales bacterium]